MAKKKKPEKEQHCGAGKMLLLGRPVAKEFKGFGTFKGHVSDFHPTTGYRITYEDGDSEDLAEASLMALLSEGPAEPLAAFEVVSHMGKRNTPPATTLKEYVSAARSAARRKRKHTELKRSGVWERKRLEDEAAREAAAKEEAERLPLHPPPEWAVDMSREGRAVRCDGAEMPEAQPLLEDHDITLYRLQLRATSATSIDLRWWFPPANPGNSGAWVGLFPASHLLWGLEGSPHGEVETASRMTFKLITKNGTTGALSFNQLFPPQKPLKDDIYVFTLHPDYGRFCRAASERFQVVGGKIVKVFEGSLSADHPSVNRKHRQQSASLNLLGRLHRTADKEAEVLDERCCFPVTSIDLALPGTRPVTRPQLHCGNTALSKDALCAKRTPGILQALTSQPCLTPPPVPITQTGIRMPCHS
jgi:hypothetical protein